MTRSRAGSTAGLEVPRRPRANSQARIESAMAAIQQKNENMAAAAATGAFIPGAGGFVGGPPVSSDGYGTGNPPLRHQRSSVRHRRDRTAYTYNGTRVRTTERICPEVPPPSRRPPTESEFWSQRDKVNLKPSLSFMKQHFFNEGRLTEEQALYILKAATNILKQEPNLLAVGDGVTVVGDIHGQFYDLLKLLEAGVGGDPAETPYLFLGDYVDRGAFGIECLLYLLAHKIYYPQTFFLLRGNHECRHLTEHFTFKKECIQKYSRTVYEACIEAFNSLPIAAVLDNKFLCVHGGIGPDLKTLRDFNRIDRFHEPPPEGNLCDILWGDPAVNYSHIPRSDERPPARVRRYAHRKGKAADRNGEGEGDLLPDGFVHNSVRGCSYYYNFTAVTNFLNDNGLLSVIRAHEPQDAGYCMYRSASGFPSLITIFSAPNYLDAYHNRAAVIKYINRNITIRQFNSQPHPYILPGHANAFTWSLPFVGAKITEMLLAILNCCTQEELEESDTDMDVDTRGDVGGVESGERRLRQEAIKNKILAVGRMAKVFELLRDEAEGASELTFEVPDKHDNWHRHSKLDLQNQRISRSIQNFQDARKYDIINERVPMIRPTTPDTYRSRSSSRSYNPPPDQPSDHSVSSPSLVPHRRRTADDDTATMIRRALQGDGDDEEDREILKLATRLSKYTVSKDVKRAYGARPTNINKMKRMDTA